MARTFALILSFMAMTIATTASAGNIVEKPDPELLKRFVAELQSAQDGQARAEEKIKSGEEKIRRAEQDEAAQNQETIRKLCDMQLLPARECH